MLVFYTGDEPGRAHASDAGADLRSRKSYTVINSQVIPVELTTRVSIPDGYMGFLFLRSSVGARGIMLVNSVGVIDAGYTGPLILNVTSVGPVAAISAGERIAQLVVLPATPTSYIRADSLGETERGENGLGSTGTLC